MTDGRYVTGRPDADTARFRLYRLCKCAACFGIGKVSTETESQDEVTFGIIRCPDCRGEGRTLQVVASATDAESIGVALVTLSQEGEWDECPLGLYDGEADPGGKWLIRPWLPSPRNVTDAAKLLRSQQKGKS